MSSPRRRGLKKSIKKDSKKRLLHRQRAFASSSSGFSKKEDKKIKKKSLTVIANKDSSTSTQIKERNSRQRDKFNINKTVPSKDNPCWNKTDPFGLKKAAKTFQKFIDKILRGIPFVYTYIDYLLIVCPDDRQHVAHITGNTSPRKLTTLRRLAALQRTSRYSPSRCHPLIRWTYLFSSSNLNQHTFWTLNYYESPSQTFFQTRSIS
ncbi:unnamed protein product [Lepeophtheirus salmonis]|uniref:(salmon louse) hypothetical protein n=1 Tax=Lepeophtheirus salmonis TaxID=72036 RepID=A0A7R8D4D6_LEPSM|nr:unnamed protein product [Lepeophtheirus salmonis]CAF2994628.1 unnamed protein product [Lepeophtheirus salmonis]